MRTPVLLTAITLFFFMSPPLPPANAWQQPMVEHKTRSGNSFIVKESHPQGQSLSDITVESRGFRYNLSETFKDRDPIRKVIIADLDDNGFDELYIITVSSGSGSYGSVLGFASNRDNSVSAIHFPEIAKTDARFDGYMGHDSFDVVDGRLARTFPVYLRADTNSHPTGEMQTVVYGLYRGEASWQLKIIHSSR